MIYHIKLSRSNALHIYTTILFLVSEHVETNRNSLRRIGLRDFCPDSISGVYQTSLSRPESRRVGIPVGTTRPYEQPKIRECRSHRKWKFLFIFCDVIVFRNRIDLIQAAKLLNSELCVKHSCLQWFIEISTRSSRQLRRSIASRENSLFYRKIWNSSYCC
jgi:hypothetical protein